MLMNGRDFGGQKNKTEQTVGRINIEEKGFYEERNVKHDDSDEEEVYVSKIWKTADITKVKKVNSVTFYHTFHL